MYPQEQKPYTHTTLIPQTTKPLTCCLLPVRLRPYARVYAYAPHTHSDTCTYCHPVLTRICAVHVLPPCPYTHMRRARTATLSLRAYAPCTYCHPVLMRICTVHVLPPCPYLHVDRCTFCHSSTVSVLRCMFIDPRTHSTTGPQYYTYVPLRTAHTPRTSPHTHNASHHITRGTHAPHRTSPHAPPRPRRRTCFPR